MAELTTASERPVSTWTVKMTSSWYRYSVDIGVGLSAHGAIEEGYWPVVVGDEGKVSDVARILRVRSDLASFRDSTPTVWSSGYYSTRLTAGLQGAR